MRTITPAGQRYVDVRLCPKSEDLSFDLSQHLPRRLALGPIVVVTDNPKIFLSVIRKRLAKTLFDLEREYARTLSRQKRKALADETSRLRTYTFTSCTTKSLQSPDVLFCPPEQLHGNPAPCSSLYITTAVSPSQLLAALKSLAIGGLLVVYGDWPVGYDLALQEYNRVVSE